MQKLSKKEAVKIIKTFIKEVLVNKKWFRNIKPHIKAVVLYGSVARGLNKPDSDIDILIILPLKIELKYTKGEYFYNYRKRSINLVLRSVERMRRLAKKGYNPIESEIFRNSEIIMEKDKEVRKLTKKLNKPAF